STQPYYERVAQRLKPTPIPTPAPQTVALEAIAGRLGAPSRRLPVALDWRPPRYAVPGRAGSWRRDLVRWMRGGGSTNKITLDDAYLRLAESRGAEIRPLHTAVRLSRDSKGLYAIECIRRSDGRLERGTLRAPRVVLAAGTLAT